MLNFFKTKNTIMYFLHLVNGKGQIVLKNTENQNFSEVFGKKRKLAFVLHLRHGVQINYLADKLMWFLSVLITRQSLGVFSIREYVFFSINATRTIVRSDDFRNFSANFFLYILFHEPFLSFKHITIFK